MRLPPLWSLTFSAALLAGCSDPPSPSGSGGNGGNGSSVFGPLGDRPDLPADQRLTIDHLSAPVDVVRDSYGRPHIYASSVADAMRVEGYLVARDRTFQLELLRRSAEGRIAELFGALAPDLVAQDIVVRSAGLARVAQAQYDAMPDSEARQVLDAYADGVTQVFQKIRSGEIQLPAGVVGVPTEAFTDWSGVDSLAVARLQSYLLSYDVDQDLALQRVLDSARATFPASDPDPAVALRAGIARDLWRFAPADPATTTTGGPTRRRRASKPQGDKPETARADVSRARGDAVAAYLSALRVIKDRIAPEGFGSNSWVIHPSRSATGHALLASDPHLALSSPATFWPVSIDVTPPPGGDPRAGMKVGGVAFPGIPGVMLGHNEHIAWGATVAGYDVTDAYVETLTPDGKAVIFNGNPVPLSTVDEVIKISGQAPYTYHVKIVPHHGPILPTVQNNEVVDPDPAVGALSVRWTGFEPTEELAAALGLLRARSVDEAKSALEKFSVGAQNWMIADVAGDILWTSHARIPVRDPRAFAWDPASYAGTLPCLALPGDGTAEWTGFRPGALIPGSKSPAAGYIATANNDPTGDTVDNDPSNDELPDGTSAYLHCSFDIGFREGRIKTRIEEHTAPFSPDDLAALQGDVRSPLGAATARYLLAAIDRAEEERRTPGTHPDLAAVVGDPGYAAARVGAARATLDAWRTEADYAAASGIDPDKNTPLPDQGSSPDAVEARASKATLLFNVWLARVLRRTLGDEYTRMGFPVFDRAAQAKAFLYLLSAEPATLATFNPATQDSAIWDDLSTPAVESRDDRLVRALLDAFTWFDQRVGGGAEQERWGAHHRVTFAADIPLFAQLSIPPSDDPIFPQGFPRHGDEFVVDASEFSLSYDVSSPPRFSYSSGPVQRFVVDLDPAGPKAWNALPGGSVWDATSPHFRDEAELWRKNQSHPVPFLLEEVIAAKASRTVLASP